MSIREGHLLLGSDSQSPVVMLDGTGATAVTQNDVVVDGLNSLASSTLLSIRRPPGG
jgi:hypothetical protein